jgi:hypothetical protein
MKNPPVVIARQANVTTGPQQINNGISRGETGIRQAQQSEASDELLPDARASGHAGGDDQTLEAVGDFGRADGALQAKWQLTARSGLGQSEPSGSMLPEPHARIVRVQ